MKNNKLLIYIILILFIISIIFNIIIYNKYKNNNNNNIETVEKVDSFIRVDTVTKWFSKPVKVEVKDTMYIHSDSVKQDGDSILLPKEEKTYTDDSTYNVRISGFNPKLEEISIYPRTIYIEKTKTVTVTKKQHWNYGIGVGFGYGMFNKKFDVFIGGTVGYSF